MSELMKDCKNNSDISIRKQAVKSFKTSKKKFKHVFTVQ